MSEGKFKLNKTQLDDEKPFVPGDSTDDNDLNNQGSDNTGDDEPDGKDHKDEKDKTVETTKEKDEKHSDENFDNTDSVDIDFSKLDKVTVETDDGDQEVYVSEDGDYINEKGEVVFTKDQVEEESESNPIKEFFDKTEIKVADESGEYKEYEPTDEGLSSYIKDVRDKAVFETLEQNNEQVFMDNLASKYPQVLDVIDHLEKHGTLQDFDYAVDINTDLKEDNLEAQRSIIRKDRKDKGESDEEVKKYIRYLEDNNELFDTAKQVQKRVKQSKEQQLEQQAQSELQEHVNFWGINPKTGKPVKEANDSIYDLVNNSKELQVQGKSFKIPETIRVKSGESFVPKTKTDFFSYLYKPEVFDMNGQKVKMSKYEYDLAVKNSNKKLSDDLYEAFTMFTNTDPLREESTEASKYSQAKKKLKVKSPATQGSKKIKLKVQRKN